MTKVRLAVLGAVGVSVVFACSEQADPSDIFRPQFGESVTCPSWMNLSNPPYTCRAMTSGEKSSIISGADAYNARGDAQCDWMLGTAVSNLVYDDEGPDRDTVWVVEGGPDDWMLNPANNDTVAAYVHQDSTGDYHRAFSIGSLEQENGPGWYGSHEAFHWNALLHPFGPWYLMTAIHYWWDQGDGHEDWMDYCSEGSSHVDGDPEEWYLEEEWGEESCDEPGSPYYPCEIEEGAGGRHANAFGPVFSSKSPLALLVIRAAHARHGESAPWPRSALFRRSE